jgi:hypothetical protein
VGGKNVAKLTTTPASIIWVDDASGKIGTVNLNCSFQAAFLLRGAGSEPRDRNNDGGSG